MFSQESKFRDNREEIRPKSRERMLKDIVEETQRIPSNDKAYLGRGCPMCEDQAESEEKLAER